MHFDLPESSAPADLSPATGPWYKELTRFHWFVLTVCALGWLFDTMDQQLFNLARIPAMRALLPTVDAAGTALTDAEIQKQANAFGAQVTAIFLIGWATGGLIFGTLGDKFGRARVMAWTILLYSACTGLSALSTGFWDFALYRFLTGLGVGGEFAVGVSLVAEMMPPRARPFALGLLQALSTVGNIMAAIMSIVLGSLEQSGAIGEAWRIMFIIGALPALLVVVIRARLKEPESWTRAVAERKANPAAHKPAGSYAELFGTPWIRKNVFVGLVLAFSGVVGLWGIGFFTVDLFDGVLRRSYASQMESVAAPAPVDPGTGPAAVVQEGQAPTATPATNDASAKPAATGRMLTKKEVDGKVGIWKGIASMLMNAGGFFGMYFFPYVSNKIGRRSTFAICFICAGLSTMMVFAFLKDFHQLFWMVPIMGFFQLSLFGGYAVYFPELFPTRLRSTGTSFCYNVGRFIAASGPALLSLLTTTVYSGMPEPFRYAGMTMCAVFLVGLLVLPFAPETKGKPLPE